MTTLMWYGIRSSGIVASVLLLLIMLSGIGQVTGWTYRFMEPVKAWLVHRWMSFAMLGLVAVHVGLLLVDSFYKFSLADAFIPFVNSYNNKSTILGLGLGWLAVPFGIIAMYALIYVVVTSVTRLSKRRRFWKLSHFASYAAMLLIGAHIVLTGTDFKSGFLRITVLSLLALLIVATVMRLRRRQHLQLQ